MTKGDEEEAPALLRRNNNGNSILGAASHQRDRNPFIGENVGKERWNSSRAVHQQPS